MMRKMTIYKPDFKKAEKKAYEVILESGLTRTPVKLKKIINSIDNLTLLSYQKFGKLYGLTKNEVIKWTQSEEGCLWYCKEDDKYLLLYNKAVTHIGRKRFTLAHELGHYFLKHNEQSERSLLSRNALTSGEIDAYEKEANVFARKLLAPPPIVDLLSENLAKLNQGIIMQVFEVSFTVAGFVLKDLKTRLEHGFSKSPHEISNLFKNDIYSLTHYYHCVDCHGRFSFENPNNCPYCSSTNSLKIDLSILNSLEDFGDGEMIYSKIETNTEGTPLKCPKCDAEDLKEHYVYCPYCSAFIHNVCLGLDHEDYYDNRGDYRNPTILEMNRDNGCDGYLDGSFRYCPSCGSSTSYKMQSFLQDWKQEKEPQEDPSHII